MPEQTVNLPPAITASDRPSDRDLQRAALRDLVTLVNDCFRIEAEIEQKHRTELDAAAAKYDKSQFVTRSKGQSIREEIEQKYAAHLTKITGTFEDEKRQLLEMDSGMRDRIEADFEKADQDLRQKLQQATWLADSVLEATQNQLRDESNKLKRDHAAQTELLDGIENRAAETLFSYGVNVAGLPEALTPAQPAIESADPAVETLARQNEAEQLLQQLQTLGAPRLLIGAKPYLIGLLLLLLAAVGAQLFHVGMPSVSNLTRLELAWKQIALAVGGMGVLLVGVGFVIRIVGQGQAKKVYAPLRLAVAQSRAAGKRMMEQAQADREARRTRATRKRELEVQAARDRFAPLASKMADVRSRSLATQQSDHRKRIERIQQTRDASLAEIGAWKTRHQTDIASREQHDLSAAENAHNSERERSFAEYADARANLQQKWKTGLSRIQAPMEEQGRADGALPRDWMNSRWDQWKSPQRFATTLQFGDLEIDLKQLTQAIPGSEQSQLALPSTFSLPALLAFPSQASLLIQHDREGRAEALRTLQMVMTQLLTRQPAGRVRFTILDPVGLGQNFAGFMHLADWDDALVGGRIWTSSEHIEQRLANLTEHMETVIQKYLRNEYETIDAYNAQAGELAEPYRFLVISDFPVGFSDDSIRRLNSIAASGARCGVYTLIAHDRRTPLPNGVNLDDLIAHSVNLVQEGNRFVWSDDVFRQFPLHLDGPPDEQRMTQLLTRVGEAAKDANRVQVSFDTIAPDAEEFWSERSDQDLHVAIGRSGATRLQMLRLGRGVAQHALVAGKTGSGKSTLLHALVTNLAMWYSPDEVEFYLVDFKKGVEFKVYATCQLPHARAIAVESDREFGLSVLQRIDAELSRRGELFRKAGVQELASYRQTDNPQIIPRTLLVIDEFQEFFSEDDKLAQDSAVLLDRLVRQGRAFGIHVLLGSQTIGGSAGLARSTIGQMAVRIALQTTEADSQLILGDNNSAARLLSRPGEAIYNDQGGLVEANSPFQVAWLPDERREIYLQRVLERARKEGKANHPASVFEGNAPADLRMNRRLAGLLGGQAVAVSNTAPLAWLGDPVAIKDPTAVALRRQSGANVLIVGQQEEAALAMCVSSLISLSAQNIAGSRSSSGATFYLLDGTPADAPQAGYLAAVVSGLPQRTRIVEYRLVPEALAELYEELQKRLAAHQTDAPPIFLFIYGLQRYRALRKTEESFGFSMSDEEKKPQPDKQFAEILREGPALGMHLITWCDTPSSVERTLDRSMMREFDHRILFQMSAADSSNLIDSPAANKLGLNRALAFSEEQGVLEKFRPYALPEKAWLDKVLAQLRIMCEMKGENQAAEGTGSGGE